MEQQINLYKILNLNPNASDKQIKKAYLKLALKYHPDKNKNKSKSSDEFIKIKNAYDILSNENSRAEYDNYLKKNNSKINSKINWNFIIKKLLNNAKLFDFDNLNNFTNCQINQKNLSILEIESIINNIVDISIEIEFTLEEIWNGIAKNIIYQRETRDEFVKLIEPIDPIQIYENSGEIIKIGSTEYIGKLIVKIKPVQLKLNGEEYYIYDNELYILIKSDRIIDGRIKITYLNDIEYKFNLNKLDLVAKPIGQVYMKKNFGLLKRVNNNIINGNLFFITIII